MMIAKRRTIAAILVASAGGLAGLIVLALFLTGRLPWPRRPTEPRQTPATPPRVVTSQPAGPARYLRPADAPTFGRHFADGLWAGYDRQFGHLQAMLVEVADDVERSAFYWRVLGKLALDRNRPASAERYLHRALALAPASVATHIGLGLVEAQRGRLAEAERFLARAVELEPWNVEALYNLGVIQARQEHFHDAEANYRRVITTQPDHFQAYFNLAAISSYYGRLIEARVLWEKVVALRGDSVEARYQLGLVYLQLKMYDQAAGEFNAALQQAPKDADIWNNLALAYQAKRDDAAAMRHFQEAHRLAPNNVTILNNLADFHLVLHQRDPTESEHLKEAIRLWERSQALNPRQERINNFLKYFRPQAQP